MDALQLDSNIEGFKDEAFEQLLSPCSFGIDDMLGNQELLPRVGDLYQAEIPSFILEHDCLHPIGKSDGIKATIDVPNLSLLGLPIPIVWAHGGIKNVKQDTLEVNGAMKINEPLEFKKKKENKITSDVDDAGLNAGYLSSLQPMVRGDSRVLHQENVSKLHAGETGFCPLPASLSESWSDVEHDCFLLGLYIFGKNLILVKRFVASKEMGDVLCFYYGKFYRSNEHRRWLDCRKTRSRKCIHGQRIFTGWRQQEMLSRLSSCVPNDCLDTLLKVSKTFGEGKISLEEYVFTLRNVVGVNNLVEVIGIGKGKQDLTGVATEPMKTNHIFSIRPEIPVGKACSSLTSADIIKFLTGDFRLSKARSSDLFWEAVWPRLLARGWHSEQPKNHGLSVSKNTLVFLIPGVKKFSRRRLVKGNHYFDSVTDVLSKVAADPGLLELESEADKDAEQDKESRWEQPIQQDPYSSSNQQRHCYLKPRSSNCFQDLIKFTIVDTSLLYGEQSKVSELRSLPINTPYNACTLESNKETSEESQDEAASNTTTRNDIDKGASSGSPECRPSLPDSSVGAIESHDCRNAHVYKQSKKSTKYLFSRKAKPTHSKLLEPCCPAAVGSGESSFSIKTISADKKLHGEDMNFQVVSQNNVSIDSPARDRPHEGIDGIVNGRCLGTEACTGNPQQPHPMINLNISRVPPEIITGESSAIEMARNHDTGPADKSSNVSKTSEQPQLSKLSDGGACEEQEPILNGRRLSTRNRPLSMKALEALACGFLSTQRKRKSGEALPRNSTSSRSSRCVRGRTGSDGTSLERGLGNVTASSTIKEEGAEADGTCNHISKSITGESHQV